MVYYYSKDNVEVSSHENAYPLLMKDALIQCYYDNLDAMEHEVNLFRTPSQNDLILNLQRFLMEITSYLYRLECQPRHQRPFLAAFLAGIKKPITPEDYNTWMNDTDHGFFHGLMTAFMAYCFTKSRGEKHHPSLFISALHHDFHCAVFGKTDEHATRLKDYFTTLLPETYAHDDPEKKYGAAPLILGDRIELYRFSDAADWVDENKIGCSADEQEWTSAFYYRIRPNLYRLYQIIHKNRSVIVHGLEEWDHPFSPDDIALYPPEGSYANMSRNDEKPVYSVYCFNSETLMQHILTLDIKSFHKLRGVIELDTARRKGEPTVLLWREHVGLAKPIPTDEWIFLSSPKLDKQMMVTQKINEYSEILPCQIYAALHTFVNQYKANFELFCVSDTL